jgi:hypothetical protein
MRVVIHCNIVQAPTTDRMAPTAREENHVVWDLIVGWEPTGIDLMQLQRLEFIHGVWHRDQFGCGIKTHATFQQNSWWLFLFFPSFEQDRSSSFHVVVVVIIILLVRKKNKFVPYLLFA